ncbi:hypothetical protein TRFO_29090 [Tritrichomonas foetus]|uniref:Transmembrane protein n=1 Tax=Tritrichomonas foetus TaxID=1144522 RepID=A0A1J4JYI6_9EUKA|nr:hypothetical protein TRFO_29090 [Tritrichomonas foetus]|eukprot:OHT03536.1 hypothetical protein TRFO_29090 [Tritrichomonas foetus]
MTLNAQGKNCHQLSFFCYQVTLLKKFKIYRDRLIEMLFLFLCFNFAVESIVENDGLLLQTYSADNIGRRHIFFSRGNTGYSIESLGLDPNTVNEYSHFAVQLAVPFWLQFIDGNYHYFPTRNIIFNSSSLTVNPTSIKLGSIECFTDSTVGFYVQNNRKENITINEVITPSREVFIPQPQLIQLRPNNAALYALHICPIEPGYHQEVLFIKTSLGTLPYIVSYHAFMNQNDAPLRVLAHHYSINDLNITYKIPSALWNSKVGVLYDASFFDQSLTSLVKRYLTLGSPARPCSNYLSFVHLLSTQKHYMIPLTILVSAKPLQPYYPIIIIPTITSKSETAEVDIKLVNPTNLNYEVTSIALVSGSPSNIKVEKTIPPIICAKNSHSVIGKIIVSGEKEGDISTSVFIEYSSKSPPIKFDMLIPVKASVLYGSLSSHEKELHFLTNTTKRFTLTNNFKVPVVVFTAKPESPTFQVQQFTPFLLMPNETSKKLEVSFNYLTVDSICDSVIKIETNASTFLFPVHGSTGKITIYDLDSVTNAGRTMIKKNLGNRYIGTVQNFTLLFNNPNPVAFQIVKVTTTPGVDVLCETEFTVEPHSNYSLNFYVTFNKMIEKKRSDQITFVGSGKSLLVTLIWVPVNGSLSIVSDDYDGLIYGIRYDLNFSVLSHFKSDIQISDIISLDPNVKINMQCDSLLVSPNQTEKAGNLSFVVDNKYIKQSKYEYLLQSERNLKHLFESWEENAVYPTYFDVLCQIKPKIFIKARFNFLVEFSRFESININIGKVLIGSYKNTTLAVPNRYGVFVHYFIRDNEHVQFEDTDFAIQGESIAIVNYLFFGQFLGPVFYLIPILTNVTPPYIVNISATIVDIKMAIEPRDVSFKFDSLWPLSQSKEVIISNKGDTDIFLDDFLIKPRGSQKIVDVYVDIVSNCSTVLQSNRTCKLTIQANSWMVMNSSNELIVQSLRTRKIIKVSTSITNNVLQQVQFMKKILKNFVIFLSLLFPTILCIFNISKSIKQNKAFRKRINDLPFEIEKVSTKNSNKNSVATQAKPDNTFGGLWVKISSEKKIDVSKEMLAALRESLSFIEGSQTT